MAEFDPVPDEHLLTAEQAGLYIPERYIDAGGVGDVTPREFALQVLVDNSQDGQAELALIQRQARNGIGSVFEFMKYWMDMGGGRHTQHMIIAMSLHPARNSMINLSDAGRNYLEASSRTPMEIMLNGALLGYLATKAFCNLDENVTRVQAGDVHIPG